MIIDIKPQVAVKAAALSKINLLGVTNNCTFHLNGSFIGLGITTICEFGIIIGHSRGLPATCKTKYFH